MSRYEIRYSCGHTAEKQLFGPGKERQSYIDWAGKEGNCPACKEAAEAATAESVETELDLPPLAGSDKQIIWARKIRSAKCRDLQRNDKETRRRVEREQPEKLEQYGMTMAEATQMLYAQTSASWWIDRRDTSAVVILADIYRALKS